MSDDLRVNGNLVGWGSHIFKINGERWFGITAIDWDEKRERTYGYGMNRSHAPIGRSPGKYTPGPVKLTMHKHTRIALNAYMKNLASDRASIGNVELEMSLQVQEGDLSSMTEFHECVMVSRTGKAEENPDPNMSDVEFNAMNIVEDDTTLFDGTGGG